MTAVHFRDNEQAIAEIRAAITRRLGRKPLQDPLSCR